MVTLPVLNAHGVKNTTVFTCHLFWGTNRERKTNTEINFNLEQICHFHCYYCLKESPEFLFINLPVEVLVTVNATSLSCRWLVSYCRELRSYSIPFMGSDVSVVKRTQRYLHEQLELSPVSVNDFFFNNYTMFVTVPLQFNVGFLC